MPTVYLLMPSGPVFPTAGEADPEITVDKHKTLFHLDRSAAERNRDRMPSHYLDYNWVVEPIEQSHDEGFIVAGHPR